MHRKKPTIFPSLRKQGMSGQNDAGYYGYDAQGGERWDNTAIFMDPRNFNIPPPPSPYVSSVRAFDRPSDVIASGSSGRLGLVLEKIHRGEVLSQHDVSAALREYNQMHVKLIEQKQKLDKLRLQTYPEEEDDSLGMPSAIHGRQDKSTKDKDVVIMKKSEKERLLAQLERKNKLITDMQARLKNLANTKTKKVLNHEIEICDLAPPAKLVDSFCDVYAKEWSDAYDTLKAAWKDDEKCVFTLFRIVRHSYIFCYDIAEEQRHAVTGFSDNLQEAMLHPTFVHPVSKLKYRASAVVSEEASRYAEIGRKLIGEYRNILVTQSVAGVQEIFRRVKLPELFESGFVNTSIRQFVDKVVELIWLMVIQDPPMMLYWLEPKRQIVNDYFSFFEEKGEICKQTVWPAIFMKEDGVILSKGVVLAKP